ncbi:TMV resistance protein N-like isoform X1 [Hevea brasiliensis]|uniref:TMV resistance protein N-like isoform X1 n=2 Tax=Hevea brasiliensis TaxID=3981 RepID=UPI0025E1D13C|nr:TMV resistance protein N-like isoform X1 [Hevea brasiliensis]
MASTSIFVTSFCSTYDVFLSFRGKDVMKGFTGHLYAVLRRSGINAYVEEEKMEDTEKIGAACLNGIQQSKFSLVLLSKDYASSTWCLEELVQILKYKKADDVWPIFYDVDTSHVEEIQGSYKEAFVEHEKHFKEDVLQKWKDALRQVSTLKGLDLPKRLDGHEAKNIDHIVEEISRRLNRTMLNVAIHPIGLQSRAEGMISLMANELEDIRIVGIYGMGGIGKSTIAKEVYNCLFQTFESSCFLENVREAAHFKGIPYLQRQLLTETSKKKHEKIYNPEIGLNLIIQKPHNKMVLLVLDDVDKQDQINKILGKCDWFSPGSRVIITTRMKDFLKPCEMYWQYEVNKMGDNDSLQLLSLHAFGKNHPTEAYMACAKKMVHYCGGIPLALEVLGSFLSGQSVDVWNSRLEKLKVIANEDIHSKFKISYDSLGDFEKFIFLDIACFFTGYDKDYVISILEECGFFPVNGINSLMRRCLVKVGSNNKMSMHDLLRDMGREIVRKEHVVDPGERSRLWHHEDVIDVLTNKKGTRAVEGLVLNMPGLKQYSSSTKTFKKMKMLRLLQLNYIHLAGDYKHISNKLRWLCWREFPLESIPFDLSLENLIILDMRYSSLKHFVEAGKSLKKLKLLNLNHSQAY